MDIQSKVQEILAEACGGRIPDRSRHLRPSSLYRITKDPWGVAMDYHGPRHEKVDETTRYERLRMSAGEKFETDTVRARFPEAVRIEGWGLQDLRRTVELMCQGVPSIRHPQLWWLPDEAYGQGDLLVKAEGPSRLGAHHYRVLEFKRSSRLQPYHRLQGALYNRMLGKLQGLTPPEFDVVLPDGDERVVFDDVSADLEEVMAQWRGIRDGTIRPELPGLDDALSPWRVYANRLLRDRSDVTLIAGFTAQVRTKLSDGFGTNSIDDLAKLRTEDFQALLGLDSGLRLYFQAQAFLKREPVLFPGASLRIPRRRRTIYWDTETADGLHPSQPPHIYLAGALENDVYRPFLAKGAENEEGMLREFLDYVGDPEDSHLLTWTSYDIGVLIEAAGRHPSIAEALHRVASACVDLYILTKLSLALPVSSYSIKQVAPELAGFHWRQGKAVDGLESMVLYWTWLDRADANRIRPVLDYNEDDVRALAAIDVALTKIASGD